MWNTNRINNTSAIQTDIVKSQSEIILQLVLVLALFLSSVTWNFCIYILLIRYKRLRTIPNLFLANHCTVNLLNTIVNLPLLILDNVIMIKEFGGKTTSWVTVLLYVTFIILNVYSMVIMMLERYVAISFGMTYKAWTSKAKAFIGIAIVWSSALIVSLTTLISVLDIDLGDKPVHIYRGEYFKKAVRYSFLVNVLLSIFGITILSLLTFKSIKLQTSQVSSSDSLSCKNAKRRLHNQSAAVKNIIIITITYGLCFVPGVIFTAVTEEIEIDKNYWSTFIIPLCVFFTGAIDPIVFISRSETLKRALKNICRSSADFSQNDFVAYTVGNLNSELSPRYNLPMQDLPSCKVQPYGANEPREKLFQKTFHVENLCTL